MVGAALDGPHEFLDLLGVLGKEGVVGWAMEVSWDLSISLTTRNRISKMRTDVEDAAEAAAPQLRQLINPEHLHIRSGSSLAGEPLLELDHLNILQSDAGVNAALDDPLGDVHSTSDGLVVGRLHPVVLCQFINLDLFQDVSSCYIHMHRIMVRSEIPHSPFPIPVPFQIRRRSQSSYP